MRPPARRRGAGAALLGVFVTAAIGVPVASAAGVPGSIAGPPARTAGADEASALAAVTGERVEVVSERGERQQLFARPGGGFTLEQSTEVRRVRQGGAWVDVDTTLRAGPDGTIRPVAAGISLALSDGGSEPLATVGDAGASVALTFPAPLPAPTLDGDTATYAEVLPGVDLEVRAHPESFTEVLVVKTPEAAAQPALRALRFGTASTGGRLAAQPDGGFALVDAAGQVVLDSPQPRMWDSGSTDTPSGGPADPTPPDPGERISELTGATADQHAPAEGDTVMPLAATLTAGAVELRPPAAMLNDPALTYPLYIDPTVTGGRQRWAMVNKTYPTTTYNNWTDADQGIGYNSYSGINVKRLFWQFDTSQIQGTYVFAARFNAYETFAANCNGGAASLWLTGSLPASPTWNAQPALSTRLDTQTLAAGRPDCFPGGRLVTWNATSAAASAATSNAPNATFALLADNETTNDGWKRFRNDASLSIDFDHLPYTPGPADLSIQSGSLVLPCATGAGRPVVGASPALRALVRDPDVSDQMFATFMWTRAGAAGSTNQDSPGRVSNGAVASALLSSAADGVYTWQARAVDQSIVFSPFSAACEFEVDTVPPAAAPVVSSVEYPQDADGGGINRQGWFVFGPAGVADVARYAYSFDGAGEKTYPATALGDTTAVPFAPKAPGPHKVLVTSLDRAGNRSPTTTYNFFARSADGPSGQWEFDADPVPTAAHDTVTGNDATFSGGTADVGRVASDRPDRNGAVRTGDQALRLSGAGSCATTTAVGVQTSASFTVAAQTRITDLAVGANGVLVGPAGAEQVVSQDGAGDSALALGYDGARSGFVLSVRTPTGTVTAAATPADTAAAVRTSSFNLAGWVSLVGVYDSNAGSIRLYVNGAQQAVTVIAQPVTAAGGFRIGCGQVRPDRLAGQVDDVRVWAQPLSAAMVGVIAAETTPSTGVGTGAATGRLDSGGSLASGQHLPSPDRSQDLWMKPDGNLVLAGPGGARWISGTNSAANTGSRAVMDPAGTLVLVNPAGTRTVLRPAAPAASSAAVSDNGGLELRRPDGTLASTTLRGSTLTAGNGLTAGEELQSPSGVYRLIMQTDGNLVLYGPSGALWASSQQSSTAPVPLSSVVLQSDGNLVVYAPDGHSTFAAFGRPGDYLTLQDDANLVLYAPATGGPPTALWSTYTYTNYP